MERVTTPRTEDLAAFLAAEAEASEEQRDVEVRYVRSRRAPRDPSQVYSLRIPVHRLEELRLVALAAGVEPSVLMRQWVLRRLDEERAQRGEASEEEALAAKLELARRLLQEVHDAARARPSG